jgi:hypothetical protein
MKNVNQPRKYVKIIIPKEIGQALQEAKEKWIESMGATVRCGGEWNLVSRNEERHKVDRKQKNARLKENKAARQNVDEAYIDRLLGLKARASPGPQENG